MPGEIIPSEVIIGIVGSEKIKFTPEGKAAAMELIRQILTDTGATEVVSGGCHLGGIDIWAEEIGRDMGLTVTVFKPNNFYWTTGYKPRNLKIAERSREVHCITVDRLPETYKGMEFGLCYHCGTTDHVKSGGCWTMKKAKIGVLHIIKQ